MSGSSGVPDIPLPDEPFLKPDAHVISYPKSGRTWLRFILCHYLSRLHGLPLDNLNLRTMFKIVPNAGQGEGEGVGIAEYAYADRPEIPFVVCAHKWPRGVPMDSPVLLLTRNVFDVLVSFYFHRRARDPEQVGEIKAFIRGSGGTIRWVRWHNRWARRLDQWNHLVLTYERVKKDPEGEMARVLAFLKVPVQADDVRHAVEASSVERMATHEQATGMPRTDALRVTSRDDLRVRRGVAGGFRDYFDEDDVEFILDTCRRESDPLLIDLLSELDLLPSDVARRYAAGSGPLA